LTKHTRNLAELCFRLEICRTVYPSFYLLTVFLAYNY